MKNLIINQKSAQLLYFAVFVVWCTYSFKLLLLLFLCPTQPFIQQKVRLFQNTNTCSFVSINVSETITATEFPLSMVRCNSVYQRVRILVPLIFIDTHIPEPVTLYSLLYKALTGQVVLVVGNSYNISK